MGRTGYHALHVVHELQQVLHAVLFAFEFIQCFGDPLLAERINGQAFNQFVVPALAGHGKTKHRVFRDPILAVRRDTHRDPFALRTQRPVAHVVDCRIGC